MEIPTNAVELVKKWEGLHKVKGDGLVYPYLCPANVWTIGYGSTRELDGTPIRGDSFPRSPEQCEQLMLHELERCVTQAIRISPSLLENEKALGAISSFIFNLGATRYKNSTLRRRINEDNMELAKVEILKWVYAGGKRLAGLYARRSEEASYL
jgi:lysozyme